MTPAITCTLVGMHGDRFREPHGRLRLPPPPPPYLSTPFSSQSHSPFTTVANRAGYLILQSSPSSTQIKCGMGSNSDSPVQFEDFLPSMATKLGVEGLIEELCKGFQLLVDPRTDKITFQSLKRNAGRLGLGELRDDELREMLREGNVNGDGVLDQMEFCVLMVRLSPELMEDESYRMFEC